jgi:hypothetical protein
MFVCYVVCEGGPVVVLFTLQLFLCLIKNCIFATSYLCVFVRLYFNRLVVFAIYR